MNKDPQIVEPGYLTSQVIDIGDFRVARGLSRRPHSVCQHARILYDMSERRVWCEDCENTIEAFDALMLFVKHFEQVERITKRKRDEAEAARGAILNRIAAKQVEKTLRRKMAVTCPHCRRGLTAKDLESHEMQSLEIEMARR